MLSSAKKINSLLDANTILLWDRFLIERIISFNCFGSPLSSRRAHFDRAKCEKKEFHSCGIWPIASIINHCCLSNVRRSFIGDLQLVRATRDIPADTELTFWYWIPTGGSYEEMQEGLKNWGFECNCAICLDAKDTPKKLLDKRSTLRGDLRTTLNASEIDVAKAEHLLSAIDKTYKYAPSKIPRFGLCAHYLKLAEIYTEEGNAVKTVSLALKSLETLGFVIRGARLPVVPGMPFEVQQWGLGADEAIMAWIHLCNAYTVFAPHLLQKAKECAMVTYKICVGEDVTFDESYWGNAGQA
jgi:SET domain